MYEPFKQSFQLEEGKNISNLTIDERVEKIEEWLYKQRKIKDRTMLYLVMYDIENDKIRTQVAKYLIKKGCLRIQKSVYLTKSNRTTYDDIYETLRDINGMYENEDSIFVMPIPEEKFAHLKAIGKNVEFEVITKPKNVLFF